MRVKTLKEYRVVWEIELYATDPRDAAQKALEMQRDPEATATVFDVYDQKLDESNLQAAVTPVRIDLQKYWKRGLPGKRK